MNKKKVKVAIAINMLTVIMTVAACIIMYTGFKFMPGKDIVLEIAKVEMLKLFTVQSNIFVGIVSLIFAIKEMQIIKGKRTDLTITDYTFKLMSTTAVGLTFAVVFAYLGPITDGGIPVMLKNSNLFFHLIIPLVSIFNFTIFEKTNKLNFKKSFYGIIPMAIYGVFYIINIFIHMENGRVSTVYDWYWFVQNGIWTIVIVLPLIFAITYFISLVIWKLNRISIKK